MIYTYDGSLYGYLSLIFDAYKDIEEIMSIDIKSEQLSFGIPNIEIKTDYNKAKRVKTSIIKKFGKNFYYDFLMAFSSNQDRKDIVTARTIKEMYKNGCEYLYTTDFYALNFATIVKNVKNEVHTYLGILHFYEYNDYLISKLKPSNDIIKLLYPHFKTRFVNEKFMIIDENRKKFIIYQDKCVKELFYDEIKDYNPHDKYEKMWKAFYNSIGIEERKNLSLMQKNMPKKYWSNLVERN